MNQVSLLLLLFFCHFLADYTWLSTSWMLNAKRLGKPLSPILCHAAIHALLMFAVLGFFVVASKTLVLLTAFQLVTHFLIDVWKGRMNGWFPSLQNPANKWHWVIFGFDQYLHAAVIIGMVYIATKQ